LQPGDVLAEIDGADLRFVGKERLPGLLLGPEGSVVSLRLMRNGHCKDVSVVRRLDSARAQDSNVAVVVRLRAAEAAPGSGDDKKACGHTSEIKSPVTVPLCGPSLRSEVIVALHTISKRVQLAGVSPDGKECTLHILPDFEGLDGRGVETLANELVAQAACPDSSLRCKASARWLASAEVVGHVEATGSEDDFDTSLFASSSSRSSLHSRASRATPLSLSLSQPLKPPSADAATSPLRFEDDKDESGGSGAKLLADGVASSATFEPSSRSLSSFCTLMHNTDALPPSSIATSYTSTALPCARPAPTSSLPSSTTNSTIWEETTCTTLVAASLRSTSASSVFPSSCPSFRSAESCSSALGSPSATTAFAPLPEPLPRPAQAGYGPMDSATVISASRLSREEADDDHDASDSDLDAADIQASLTRHAAASATSTKERVLGNPHSATDLDLNQDPATPSSLSMSCHILVPMAYSSDRDHAASTLLVDQSELEGVHTSGDVSSNPEASLFFGGDPEEQRDAHLSESSDARLGESSQGELGRRWHGSRAAEREQATQLVTASRDSAHTDAMASAGLAGHGLVPLRSLRVRQGAGPNAVGEGQWIPEATLANVRSLQEYSSALRKDLVDGEEVVERVRKWQEGARRRGPEPGEDSMRGVYMRERGPGKPLQLERSCEPDASVPVEEASRPISGAGCGKASGLVVVGEDWVLGSGEDLGLLRSSGNARGDDGRGRARGYHPPAEDSRILGGHGNGMPVASSRGGRRVESSNLKEKARSTGRVPMVITRVEGSPLPVLGESKFVVPSSTTVASLATALANRLSLPPPSPASSPLRPARQGLALLVEGEVTCPGHVTLGELHGWHGSDADGLLRLWYDVPQESDGADSPSLPAAEVYTLIVM